MEFIGKSMETETTTWSEFSNGGKPIVEQILASEEIYKFKRTGLWESQSGIWVGKLTTQVRSFEIEKLPGLSVPPEQKIPSLPRNLALDTFGELLIVFSTKVNLLYLLYSTDRRCCLLHLIKQNYLLKTFPRTLILMTLVFLYLFSPSRTNLKLHKISITPKMVKKVITNLDSSKASGPDCIPVVVLKNCELELSYILAKLLDMCLKESCFPDCWKVSLVVPVFKNVGERSTAENYRPVSLLYVVSKVFKKLVNNRIVDHLKNCGLFSDFDQLQIFWQFCLIELLGLLAGLGRLEL